MSKDRIVRFDDDIDPLVDLFLEKHNLTLNQMMNLAIVEFISKQQTIKFEPIDSEEWSILMKKAYAKHRHAMDKLKD